ncbi:hypothetical protein Bca4012_010692 [Brassica carinata]|uniref:Uncharacterized protein n=1 Tax=Brassica carinata TaxID=52824 RepID=A0A8X7V1X9_BRACI|nr:hypothetical protein Bca52824_035604 [Brassica carinata]
MIKAFNDQVKSQSHVVLSLSLSSSPPLILPLALCQLHMKTIILNVASSLQKTQHILSIDRLVPHSPLPDPSWNPQFLLPNPSSPLSPRLHSRDTLVTSQHETYKTLVVSRLERLIWTRRNHRESQTIHQWYLQIRSRSTGSQLPHDVRKLKSTQIVLDWKLEDLSPSD